MLALVPPENVSPRSLNEASSKSKRGKYWLSPKFGVALGENPRLAGLYCPW
jgi:hypothetical protein